MFITPVSKTLSNVMGGVYKVSHYWSAREQKNEESDNNAASPTNNRGVVILKGKGLYTS